MTVSMLGLRNEKLATLEFDRDRKSMSTICKGELAHGKGRKTGNVLLVKGAAECVLSRCTQVGVYLRLGHDIPADSPVCCSL